MGKYETQDEILAALAAPFAPKDIEWRIQSSGMSERNGQQQPWARVLAYVNARAIRRRLNEVLGPAGWQTTHFAVGDRIGCAIGVKLDSEWVWKSDGAGDTQFESDKGAFTSAFKRAAYSWTIGEYLYDLPVGWAQFHNDGEYRDEIKASGQQRGTWYRWSPPKLPSWALPREHQQESANVSTESSQERKPKSERGRKLANSAYRELNQATNTGLMTQSESKQWWDTILDCVDNDETLEGTYEALMELIGARSNDRGMSE